VIKGTLKDIQAIESAVKDTDAVVSILGPSTNVKTTELSDGTRNIITGMKKFHVCRLVAMGTASVEDGNDLPSFKFRLLVGIVKRLIPGAYCEIRKMGAIIKESDLEWTMIRLALLTNGPAKGIQHIGYYGRDKLNLGVSRKDLARFFVDQVQDNKYIRKAPAISN